jgi:hypothetical protein
VCGIDIGYANLALCVTSRDAETGRLDCRTWKVLRIAQKDDTLEQKLLSLYDLFDLRAAQADFYAIENQHPVAQKEMIALMAGLHGYLCSKVGRDRVFLLHPATVKRAYGLCKGSWAKNKSAVVEFLHADRPDLSRVKDHNLADAYLLSKYFLEHDIKKKKQ